MPLSYLMSCNIVATLLNGNVLYYLLVGMVVGKWKYLKLVYFDYSKVIRPFFRFHVLKMKSE